MFTRLLDRLRRRAPAAKAAEPAKQSRAAKYESDNVMLRMLQAQREATQAQFDAFMRQARDATLSVKVEAGPGDKAPAGAMDAKAKSAMDDGVGDLPAFKAAGLQAGPQMGLLSWFMQQGFIGWQNCAFLAQHWLVYKACAVPVEDAIRVGYDITTASGEDIDDEDLKKLKAADRKFGVMKELREFGIKGRIFGVRIALFEVESDDPHYYEKPFNLDGVKKDSYKGISQVDPYWCAPILDITSSAIPSSRHFYEPTWWLIGSRRVHRSHLVIFRYADPPDVLKPMYLFGGIPLTQMIMERVYCAERTANEAPALALSKRTTVWLTSMSAIMADTEKANQMMNLWIQTRDNFGIKLGDKNSDEFQQFDTPLGDFDSLVMTQYGLVAATAGCPITKLLGTTPGGFAATGEYDEASYHESLESMEERDFTPFLHRHHQLVVRSEGIALTDQDVVVNWHSLDVMTHVEQSQVNLNKAETGAALMASGAITPQDERARVATDKDSGYHGIGKDLDEEAIPDLDDPELAAKAAGGARRGAEAAVAARQEEGGKKARPVNGKKLS